MTLLAHKKSGVFATENLLPLFVVCSLGLNVLAIVLVMVLGVYTARLANRPEPRMMQLVDGRSVLSEPVDHLDRAPETIRLFTKQAMTMMFTWSPVQAQDGSGAARTVGDEGVKVGNTRATTKSWQASFTLSEDFRAPFLIEVGGMTPRDVFAGNAQSVFNIESLTQPRQLGSGRWEIELVANLVIFNQRNAQGVSIPFNKKIYLRAIEPPSDPLSDEATGIQKAVYRIRSSGLQITEMHELVP